MKKDNSVFIDYSQFLSMFGNERNVPSIAEADRVIYGSALILEKRTSGKRLLDHIEDLHINEEGSYLHLSESEKYEVENVVWESVLAYISNDEAIFEGIWRSMIGGISNLSKKALKAAKSLVQNIGKVIKGIGEWVVEFFKKAKALALKAGQSAFSSVKGKIEDKFSNRKKAISEEATKKEGGELKDTVEWLTSDSSDTTLEMGAKDAASAAQEAGDADEEEKEKMLKQIASEMEGGKNESLSLTYIRVINEIRSTEDWDYTAFINEANDYNELCLILAEEKNISEASEEEIIKREEEKADKKPEPQVDGSPKEGAEEKKQSILSRLKDGLSIKNIISIFTSGLVYFFEKAAEYLLREKAFPKLSAWVKKAGGPGVYKFAITAGVIAVILGVIAEFGLSAISELTGAHAFEQVHHALHATNPLALVDHAVMHIPGGSTYAKVIAVCIVTYLGFDHIKHLLHPHDDHHDDKHDDKDKEEKHDDKDKEEKKNENESINISGFMSFENFVKNNKI